VAQILGDRWILTAFALDGSPDGPIRILYRDVPPLCTGWRGSSRWCSRIGARRIGRRSWARSRVGSSRWRRSLTCRSGTVSS